ncbi:MAG: PTS sugar transporter [Spirochaetaceae bacterium]|nr:MAG: PTS sugar transporter [Spirochaetaceae bacterium]
MDKRIAVLGSSGGNLYNIGGSDPRGLIGEIAAQAGSVGIELGAVQFVAARSSMDQAKTSTQASLLSWSADLRELVMVQEGTLEQVNARARDMDAEIAEQINAGTINALVLVSCDPEGANSAAIKAAVAKKIPVAGTGGTSMAKVQAAGANVISTSGTTGSTNRTRAIGAISAICREWKVKYTPVIGSSGSFTGAQGDVFSRIKLRGIMMAALPGFIAMALLLALSRVPGLGGLGDLFSIVIGALPVVIAAIAAKQVSGMDDVGIVAGIVAGVLSTNGGIIGGLIGGILAGILAYYLVRLTIHLKFPATTVGIVSGGLSGLIAGFAVYFLVAPLALMAGDGIRSIIEGAIEFNAVLAGTVAGLLIWPAILGGVYHAAILPIVLLEMELAGNSFLGAVDMTGLVMVSAGITLANIVFPREKSESTLAAPGFLINVGFGTFVEAAYPFMFSNKFVFAGAIASAGISGFFVGLFGVRGTAYVPAIIAPTVSNTPLGFLLSMLIALGSAFVFTTLANKLARKKQIAA